MPESYFEDATITIEATLSKKKYTRTKPYTGPAKICFYKGEEEEPFFTSVVNAVDGKIEKPFKHRLPKVEPKEEFYDLKVRCEYLDKDLPLLSAQIWPKQTKVKFQNAGEQAYKAVEFLVKQPGEDDQRLTAGNDGTSIVTLLARKSYTITPAGSFKVIEEKQATQGEFRDHVLTVESVIKAKFRAPDFSTDAYVEDADAAPAHQQWINLKPETAKNTVDSGCDAKGQLVVVTVTSDPPEEGQAGDKVYFEINFGGESKRSTPAPALTATFPIHDKVVDEKKTTGHVILGPFTGEDALSGVFEIELGAAGGDTCEIKIGGTPEVEEGKIRLINWRRIYAQVTKTSALSAGSLAPAQACLKKVHVDLTEAVDDHVNLSGSQIPAGAVVDGTKISSDAPAECLIVGTHNIGQFSNKLNARFKSENLPVAHLIYCNVQVDGASTPHDAETTLLGTKTGQVQTTVDFPGGGTVPGVKIVGTDISRSARFFSIDVSDGTDAVKECKWEEVGGSGTGTISSADYKIDQVAHGDALFIRLPEAAKTLSDAGKSIKVTAQVAHAAGWYNGWCTSAGRHLVIRVGRPDQDICGTIVHEVGHAFFQVANAGNASEFPGLPTPPHERWYTNTRGHSGNHCADGVSDSEYNEPTFKMNSSAASDACTCIMFGAGSTKRNQSLAFCSKCLPYAKAAKIAEVST